MGRDRDRNRDRVGTEIIKIGIRDRQEILGIWGVGTEIGRG